MPRSPPALHTRRDPVAPSCQEVLHALKQAPRTRQRFFRPEPLSMRCLRQRGLAPYLSQECVGGAWRKPNNASVILRWARLLERLAARLTWAEADT